MSDEIQEVCYIAGRIHWQAEIILRPLFDTSKVLPYHTGLYTEVINDISRRQAGSVSLTILAGAVDESNTCVLRFIPRLLDVAPESPIILYLLNANAWRDYPGFNFRNVISIIDLRDTKLLKLAVQSQLRDS